MGIDKYIELEQGTKKPKHKLDTFVTDISNIADAALLIPDDVVVVDFDHCGHIR